MAYVITDACTKDANCVDVCPVDCIHPRKDDSDYEQASQLFVDPGACIDCGACIPVCPASAIYTLDDIPENLKSFIEANASHYSN